MHQATLGAWRLLARPGEGRLWLLDASAAAFWDLHQAGWAPAPLAGLLVEHFALAPEAARAYVDDLHAQWQATGLLADEADLGGRFTPVEPLTSLPPPAATPPASGAWRLQLAERPVSLRIADPALRARIAPLVPARDPLPKRPAAAPLDHLVLAGAAHWNLTINGQVLAAGQGQDAGLVALLSTLTELGCCARERLLVVHGAGLVAPDGRGLLLIAPGGAGKSTLTAALEATGYGLLSDDVVPVNPAGELLGLGMPLCLKAGSWPLLAPYRPDLAQAPTLHRFGQAVRYLPPRGRPLTGPLTAALLLFPSYRPGIAPSLAPLPPEGALQAIVAAEAVIRDLDQAKLEALARWVSAVPALALNYPDLDTGLTLVRECLEAPG